MNREQARRLPQPLGCGSRLKFVTATPSLRFGAGPDPRPKVAYRVSAIFQRDFGGAPNCAFRYCNEIGAEREEDVAMNPADSGEVSAIQDAKRLMRLSRTGALATLEFDAPLTTLIAVASDWDGSPLFLMSDLARHSRNIAADNRVSLLLTSETQKGDPLNNPRVTLNGRVAISKDPTSRQRYLRRNPKAKLYVDFADFTMRRLTIESVHFNGGFGRADEMSSSNLLTAAGDFSALAKAEDTLLAEIESLGTATLLHLIGDLSPGRSWRPVGIDAEGFDLAAGGMTARIDFPRPALDPTLWRALLSERAQK